MMKPSTTLRMNQLPLEDKDGRWRGMGMDRDLRLAMVKLGFGYKSEIAHL